MTRSSCALNWRSRLLLNTKTCNPTTVSKRCFMSKGNEPMPYQYPLRTEKPIITRAVVHKDLQSDASSSTKSPKSPVPPSLANHFDENVTSAERLDIIQAQRSSIATIPANSPKIQPSRPSSIPPNLPSTAMITPETQLTTLDNGLRVASQETYGQVSCIGMVSNCGSRFETQADRGVNHLMEALAFCGTQKLNGTDFQHAIDHLGGVNFAHSSREQFMYCLDILRPNVNEGMQLLSDIILRPNITDLDVENVKKMVEYQWLDMAPEVLLGEGLQLAAYGVLGSGQEQQLGKTHFCPLEALPYISKDVIVQFREQHLLNPHNVVIAGAGIQHSDLLQLSEQHFGHLTSASDSDPKAVDSVYTGGTYRKDLQTPDGFTRVALAFETGGWHSDDLVPACVLQTLLGGGSSFSAGGPGKGMYSRLYRQVLNRYYWAESCEAFTSFHNESGLLGISGSAPGDKAGDMTKVLIEHFMKLACDVVEDEELDRARNMLKCNVLTQLESRLVLFEDVGRQILTYGERQDNEEMCDKIDNVTGEVLRDLVRKAVGMDKGKSVKPTVCAVGDTVSFVPPQSEIERWFESLCKQ